MPDSNLDLFKPIVDAERRHPSYEQMRTSIGAEPARLMANELFQSFPNPDGNFIEQFQSTGYDSRIFELYLYAYLSHSGFKVSREHDRPDFIISRNDFAVAVEATTINPTQVIGRSIGGKRIEDLSRDELREKIENEIPIRFGGPLHSKLAMRYWEMDHCRGLPLVFAIEAFHEEDSLYFSDSSLVQYAYGLRHFADWTEDGQLVVRSTSIGEHRYGSKVIPSGFFQQSGAEHVSAVIFSNSGTFAKFERMGYQAGYHRGNLIMVREGTCYHPDSNATQPRRFAYNMDDAPIKERWGQGLTVLHNPNALLPIPRGYFADATETYLEDGQLLSDVPRFHPYMSQTITCFYRRDVFDSPEAMDTPVRSILRSEFDAFRLARTEASALFVKEKEWFTDDHGRVLGVLLLDRFDEDWAYAILGRDQFGTFRWVEGQHSIATPEEARDQLLVAMLRVYDSGQTVFPQ